MEKTREREFKELNENFKKLIESIERQSIRLEQLEFYINPEVEGKFQESTIERIFEIDEVEIAKGEAIPIDNEEKVPFFKISYVGLYEDSIINKDTNAKENKKLLAKAKFTYSVILIISPQSSFNKLSEGAKIQILSYFANTTGKIMIFPYIRHLLYFLSTEAGLQLPPINPLLINPKRKSTENENKKI